MTLSALLVDLDGTLVDSLPALERAYERFLAAHHQAASEAEFMRLSGPPLPVVVAGLVKDHGLREDPRRLVAEYSTFVEASYEDGAPLAPGAESLLSWAASKQIHVALVTSAPHALAEHLLQARGVRELVAVIIGGDDTPSGKPAPDPYRAAMARLGVSPANAVALEDSPVGVSSAVAAGVRCLAVGPMGDACVRAGALVGLRDLHEAGELIASLTEGPGRIVRAKQLEVRTGGAGPLVSMEDEAKVTAHWQEANAHGPARTDGEIVSVVDWRSNGSALHVAAMTTRDRYPLAQRRGLPLGVRNLRVTGLTRVADGRIVLGRRARGRTQYPGWWETLPSVDLSARHLASDGRADVEAQLREEALAGLGLQPAQIERVELLGLIEDLAEHVVDVCFTLRVDATEAQLKEGIAQRKEHDALELVEPERLLAWQAGRQLLPVSVSLLALDAAG